MQRQRAELMKTGGDYASIHAMMQALPKDLPWDAILCRSTVPFLNPKT